MSIYFFVYSVSKIDTTDSKNTLHLGPSRGTIPQTGTQNRALLDRWQQLLPYLDQKGSLTTQTATGWAGTIGNPVFQKCWKATGLERKWTQTIKKD